MGEISLSGASPDRWTIIGGPSAGKVAALAIGKREGHTVFAGTQVGLYRTGDVGRGSLPRWTRLPDASLEIMSLAVSPCWAQDHTILAGTARGLFLSRDGGDRWRTAQLPIPDPMILTLCFSPDYVVDGIILAGTLEDGVLYSSTRGETWSYRGFGLLDATVYSLAISPGFAHDEMVFAGTETALYYSYNGARAWKRLDFPEDAAPILALALSPNFARDHTLYAGTESAGLLRTTDLGSSWVDLGLPASCVNALAISPEDGTLFAATESGLYCSEDEGHRWTCSLGIPNVLSLAVNDGLIAAGLVDDGVRLASGGTGWLPFLTMPVRPLVGMVLSPRFDADRVGFLYGPQEGIWRTVDGGSSWKCLDEELPSPDIRSLVLSPGFPRDGALVAASSGGVLLSEDAGDSWSLWSDEPASLVARSPNGKVFAAVSAGGAVRVSAALRAPWQSIPGPWQGGREVLALSLDDGLWCRVAILDRAAQSLGLWEGYPGSLRQILSRPASARAIAAFWVPANGGPDERWYASLDDQVWELRRSAGEASAPASLIFEAQGRGRVLSLTGTQVGTTPVLFACTGETIYKSTGTKSWTAVWHFGDERALALLLSLSYVRDSTAFALLLGGSFCRGTLD